MAGAGLLVKRGGVRCPCEEVKGLWLEAMLSGRGTRQSYKWKEEKVTKYWSCLTALRMAGMGFKIGGKVDWR